MDEASNKEEPSKHLLLALAETYPEPTGDLAPEGCRYDLSEGAWMIDDVGSLLINSPNRPRPMTKKRDIETGEDHKAE